MDKYKILQSICEDLSNSYKWAYFYESWIQKGKDYNAQLNQTKERIKKLTEKLRGVQGGN